jgi:hypothetical protein
MVGLLKKRYHRLFVATSRRNSLNTMKTSFSSDDYLAFDIVKIKLTSCEIFIHI